MMIPNVIVANDIVGVGKVAAAISLPILASCQVETQFLPTVILSSHTGGFKEIASVDFSETIPEFLKQWAQFPPKDQVLFTGYCASLETYHHLLQYHREQASPLAVDPIMADRGKLYAGFTAQHVIALRALCQEADIIFPNLTEACLLSQQDILVDHYDQADILALAQQLGEMGPDHIIITGLSFSDSTIGIAYYHKESQELTYHMSPAYPHHFFGTGDLLSAILTAGYAHHLDLNQVIPMALDFLDTCLQTTLASQRDLKWGLIYEPHLGQLHQAFNSLVLGVYDEK